WLEEHVDVAALYRQPRSLPSVVKITSRQPSRLEHWQAYLRTMPDVVTHFPFGDTTHQAICFCTRCFRASLVSADVNPSRRSSHLWPMFQAVCPCGGRWWYVP